MPLRPEGFYRIRLEGRPGVAYCQHQPARHWNGGVPYEVWTTLHLFDRFDDKPHPATCTLTSRDDPRFARNLEVLSRIKV